MVEKRLVLKVTYFQQLRHHDLDRAAQLADLLGMEKLLTLFSEHPIEWSLLFLVLLALAYGAVMIKNEKRHYLKGAQDFSFHGLNLKVPGWWGVTENEDERLSFKRLDTHYDWYATMHWLHKVSDLEESANSLLQERGIVLDSEADKTFGKNHRGPAWLRLEGTGTQNENDRIYYDLFLLDAGENLFVAESRSSILNGCVEGPYFEEMLKRLRPIERAPMT